MKPIIFDIETGPLPEAELAAMCPPFDPDAVKLGNTKDPEKVKARIDEARSSHFADFCADAALDPLKGRVLCIGLYYPLVGQFHYYGQDDERELLEAFWAAYRSHEWDEWQLFGFNIFGFDLPFLIKRSWKHNILPPCLREGRYWSNHLVDLMESWVLGDRRPEARRSLGAICQHLGLGQKSGSGADFAGLWATDRSKAKDYLKNDLQLTAKLAHRILF